MTLPSPPEIITIKAFAEAGIFKPRSVGAQQKGQWMVRFPRVRGRAHFDSSLSMLRLWLGGQGYTCDIMINSCRVGHGIRHYFVCDCCCDRRQKLVFLNAAFVCQAHFLREASNIRQSHRRGYLFMAEKEVMENENGANFVYFDNGILDKPQNIRKKRYKVYQKYTHKLNSMETNHAFSKGQVLIYSDILNFVNDKDEYFIKGISTGDDMFVTPIKPDVLKYYPSLDIRALVSAFPWAQGVVMAQTLAWGDAPPSHSIAMIIDWRGRDPVMACVHHWQDLGDAVWQQLPLHCQPDGRLRFICPIRRVNCDVLYLRDGIFASREAQRLYHPSQRAAGRSKSARGELAKLRP